MTRQDAIETHTTDCVIESAFDVCAYRTLLPNADTDYIKKKPPEGRQPYERELLGDVLTRVAPGDLVVDVGANIGIHTPYPAAAVGCRPGT